MVVTLADYINDSFILGRDKQINNYPMIVPSRILIDA